MLISIIIPFLDKWELVHARMFELTEHAPANCEIVLVNDASKGEYTKQVAFWQKQAARHPVRYIKNEKNLGFGGAMNTGAKVATGDILVFLSNDVQVFGNFIDEIVILLERNKALVGAELLDWDTGWNMVDGRPMPYLNGWLVACTRSAWEDIGGFDLQFFPFDYEDMDLSLTALMKGYNLLALKDKHVKHIGAQTAKYGPEREAITKEHQKMFIKKWSGKVGFLDNFANIT